VQQQGHEQKLWLILFQLRTIRARINSLAAQYFAFSSLAILILAAAVILAAASLTGPLAFLSTGIAVVLAALVSVIRVTRIALGSSVNPVKAASLADERSVLKGRLTTVLWLEAGRRDSEFARFLIEDTYDRRKEFEPAKIEPHWLSKSIIALAGACFVALLLLRVTRWAAELHVNRMPPSRVIAELGNLDIRPADPALEPNAEIYADETTMRKLADKLASAGSDQTGNGSLSQWLNKAQRFASDLQNKLTGQQRWLSLELKLSDDDVMSSRAPSSPTTTIPDRGQSSGNSNGAAKPGADAGTVPTPSPGAGQLAQGGAGFAGMPSSQSGQPNPGDLSSPQSSGTEAGDGVSHGSGTDPEHLFGPPTSQPMGTDTFKITIDAQPSDESSTPGAPAYVPPKVSAPLNQRQSADEPIARASIPPADEMAIKHVFER
jgi:hypothetical protein